jgi:hypothetical protein
MRSIILIAALSAAPAWPADPVALTHAQEFKAAAIASNAAFSLCMGCAAVHQAQIAADLSKYLAQCQAEYPTALQRLADCQQYYHSFYDGQ